MCYGSSHSLPWARGSWGRTWLLYICDIISHKCQKVQYQVLRCWKACSLLNCISHLNTRGRCLKAGRPWNWKRCQGSYGLQSTSQAVVSVAALCGFTLGPVCGTGCRVSVFLDGVPALFWFNCFLVRPSSSNLSPTAHLQALTSFCLSTLLCIIYINKPHLCEVYSDRWELEVLWWTFHSVYIYE